MKKLDKNINKDSEKYREYEIKKAAIYKIVAFLSMLLIGAIVSFVVPLRPTVSLSENRNLTTFPEFSLTAFMDGDYFKQLDTWFSDTFPFRDQLISCSENINSMYGIRSRVLHGEVVAGDEIPDVDIDMDDLNQVDSSVIQANAQTGNQTGNQSAQVNSDQNDHIDADDVGTVVEDTDGSIAAQSGERLDSIFVVNNAAYNYYAFSQNDSDAYSDVVNNLANKLEGQAVVYDMIVPTSIDVTLDDATRNSLTSSNQKKAILYMYSRMNSNVRKSYVYDVLKSHRDEYIFFRTDHHWTALGAYYAYSSFITQLGYAPNSINSYEQYVFDGFKGSFFTQSGVTSLGNNPDTVYAYKPLHTNRLQFQDREGKMVDYNVITDVSEWNATSKYSTFIGGDNAYTQINNPGLSDGSSCLVVKESFGNAFVPFLSDHFENVYVVDYRYYEGKVSDLVSQYGINTVLIINNISATSTLQRISDMQKVCN